MKIDTLDRKALSCLFCVRLLVCCHSISSVSDCAAALAFLMSFIIAWHCLISWNVAFVVGSLLSALGGVVRSNRLTAKRQVCSWSSEDKICVASWWPRSCKSSGKGFILTSICKTVLSSVASNFKACVLSLVYSSLIIKLAILAL